MPTNNFKLFDENKANLLTDTEYANATQRLNGVQTGVASSQLNNKFAYQVSLVAYSIAQLMNANGLDASDTLAVSAFVGNLQGALLQKVADKATTAEAAAGVLSNKYITPETMKAAALLLSGGVMNGILDMGSNRITNLGTPTESSDAVTKEYVDGGKLNAKDFYKKIGEFTNPSLDTYIALSESFNTQNLLSIALKIDNFTFNDNDTSGGFYFYLCSGASSLKGVINITKINFSTAFNGFLEYNFSFLYSSISFSSRVYGICSYDYGQTLNIVGMNETITGIKFGPLGSKMSGTIGLYIRKWDNSIT